MGDFDSCAPNTGCPTGDDYGLSLQRLEFSIVKIVGRHISLMDPKAAYARVDYFRIPSLPHAERRLEQT